MAMLFEDNHRENKTALNDKLEKEVVAFLNSSEGGILYIGVDDEGKPVGVIDVDDVQLRAADRIKNNILPTTLGLFDIAVEVLNGANVVKIIVSSGTEKPYYDKRYGMSEKGCFVRVGSSSRPMSQRMIDDLYSRRVRTTLRNIRAPRQGLTFEQLKIYYQERSLTLNDSFAQTLELLTDQGDYNYVAYLLSDENGVSIKVARYAGSDKCDLVENEEYGYCSIIKAAHRVLDRMRVENVTKARITETTRVEKSLVDGTALREAVINAIVHNDWTTEYPPIFEVFSDRIAITSYGGLIPEQSKDEFFSCCSMPRNRELMRVFRDVELVEQLGSGMTRILRAYDQSVFDIRDRFIRVTLPFSKEALMLDEEQIHGLDDLRFEQIKNSYEQINEQTKDSQAIRESALIRLVGERPSITYDEAAKELGVSYTTARRTFDSLVNKKIVVRVGSRKTGIWQIVGAQMIVDG